MRRSRRVVRTFSSEVGSGSPTQSQMNMSKFGLAGRIGLGRQQLGAELGLVLRRRVDLDAELGEPVRR